MQNTNILSCDSDRNHSWQAAHTRAVHAVPYYALPRAGRDLMPEKQQWQQKQQTQTKQSERAVMTNHTLNLFPCPLSSTAPLPSKSIFSWLQI